MAGNTTMILPAQLGGVVTERTADGAVVDSVQHQPPLIVGEPDDELLLLLCVLLDFFFGNGLDAEFLLALKIGRL